MSTNPLALIAYTTCFPFISLFPFYPVFFLLYSILPTSLLYTPPYLSRTYRYFFVRRSLDVSAMAAAAKLFEGDHDFRNFCKVKRYTKCKRALYCVWESFYGWSVCIKINYMSLSILHILCVPFSLCGESDRCSQRFKLSTPH